MSIELWKRVLSSDKPCRFRKSSGMLELRSCALQDGERACRISCKPSGLAPVTVASLSDSSPCRRLKSIHDDDAEFTCTGGAVLLVGVLLPRRAGRGIKRSIASATEEVPKTSRQSPNLRATSPVAAPAQSPKLRAAHVEAPMPKRAVAKVAPAKPAVPMKPLILEKTAPMSLQSTLQSKRKLLAEIPAEAAGTKAEKPATPISRRTLNSGLAIDVLKPGAGAMVKTAGIARVRYEGRLAKTGKIFDKGEISFRLGLGEVIRGWDEGIQGMLTGEVRRLYVPSRLGYGVQGAGQAIPPHADLLFEVEVLSK